MVHRDSLHVPLTLALLAATLVTPLSLVVALFSVPFDLAGRILVVGTGGLAQLTVSYVSLYRPVSRLRSDIREQLMQILLDELRRDYGSSIAKDVDLRANVMLVERRFTEGLVPRRRKRLRITYHSGEDEPAELDQQYAPGEGCWGRALRENDPTYYDEQRNPHPAREMTATQKRVTDHVASVASVPIYRPGAAGDEVVGILNLDSRVSTNSTKFNEGDAHRYLMNYAGLAGHVLA